MIFGLKKPKEVLVEVVKPVFQTVFVKESKYRNGMWVMTSEGVAISSSEGFVLISEDGTNKLKIEGEKAVPHIVKEAERQAFLEEIPESRRPSLVNVFGYESAQ